jgi:hypothetical protein
MLPTTCLILAAPLFARELVPLEQSEPDIHHHILRVKVCPTTYWEEKIPGIRFPEFLEMSTNNSIEHWPQAGFPDSGQRTRDGSHNRVVKPPPYDERDPFRGLFHGGRHWLRRLEATALFSFALLLPAFFWTF